MNWQQVKLGDIFEIARGGSPRPIDQYITDDPNGLNWISIKDASNSSKYIYKTEKKIKPEGLHKTRLVHPDDFLLTNSMSFGRPYIMKTTGCIHDGWLVLSADKSRVDTDYFYHLLGSDFMYRKFAGLAAGAVVKNLNTELVKSISVPLPPLAEQRRIASILDKADDLRQKRQQAIEKLDQLLQATFIDMFGDPISNPKGWDKVKFENEVEFLTGFAFKSADFKDSGIKLCRGINILPNTLDWNDTAYWNIEELEKYARFKILQNDILVAMDRPWISTGFKITLVKENDPHMLLVQRVARLRVKESFGANFLFQILSMPEFKKHCRITETTVPHISPTDFKSFELIKPDNHLIEKFEKIAKLIHSQKAKMWNSSLKYKNLFDSLQNQAFSGTL
ncbi:restriction endonuclease subunit S [Acinetobacter baumannii]|uniref:restriction endonuclease subunit S n=1 Tax=Acinetobacter baumannii TaxID=470 RepID=UPI0024488C0A|nr:restriction endonuclease subunit S [Acinetobacter baumannii]MDH2596075.1 restriction endonuclease subunit S [Acinetobacter baumannii]